MCVKPTKNYYKSVEDAMHPGYLQEKVFKKEESDIIRITKGILYMASIK